VSITSDIRRAVRRAGASQFEVTALSAALYQLLSHGPRTSHRQPCAVPIGAESGNYLLLTVHLQGGRIVAFDLDANPDPESAVMRAYAEKYAEWKRAKDARDNNDNPKENR
jgi:hypothetical protein